MVCKPMRSWFDVFKDMSVNSQGLLLYVLLSQQLLPAVCQVCGECIFSKTVRSIHGTLVF